MNKRLVEIEERKAEIRSASKNVEIELETLKAFNDEIETLTLEERKIEEKYEIAQKINNGEIRGNKIIMENTQVETKNGEMEYRNAFMQNVLKGTAIPAELRADASSKTTDIGNMIPLYVQNKIIDKMESLGQILALVTKTAFAGGVAIPFSSVKPVATWVAEGAGSDRQKKVVGSIVFNYYKLRCAVSVSLESNQMSLSAFEATLISNISDAMTRAIEQAILNGTGVGSPKGILTETPVAGQAITATPVYKKLLEAEGALPLAYETGAVYCMTKKTFMAFIAEVDTAGQPVARVNTGINGKPERTLLGRTVVLCDYLPNYATSLTVGTAFAFLFNFSDYILNTNFNMGLKKFEDVDTEDQVTKAIMLVDGKAVDIGSLVTLVR